MDGRNSCDTNSRDCGRSESKADRTNDDRAVVGARADEDLAAFTKALGHPHRIQIMRILIERDSCVCGEIVEELPLAQSTVSQHLKVLKEAGLIKGEIEGANTCYCVDPRALRRFKILVAGL